MLKASEIDWDIDMDEAFEYLDKMSEEEAAEALEVSVEDYIKMDEEGRHDLAEDRWHHCPVKLDEFMGLPNEVVIPEEIEEIEDETEREEAITNWLSDEYGFCVEGYELLNDQKESSQEIEVWQGIHASITAPKGLFDKIYNEAKDDEREI